MNREDDASYKLLFSSPEVVRDLVMGFIPDDWLHSLDSSTLEKVPGSYVTDDLRQRADDVIWRVRADGEWVYLYLLIEFQSMVDAWMAVRIMTYVGLLYQDLIRRGEILKGRKLPPVLPIVLYNGSSTWAAATDVADLIPRAPGRVSNYLPRLKYLLIDENRVGTVDLKQARNLMAAIIQVERPENDQALLQLLDLLNDWLADNPELRRTFAIWIRAVVLRQSRHELALPKVRDLKELKMALAERFDLWARQHEEKGMLKGREEGREEGVAGTLALQIAHRFGDLPEWAGTRLSQASEAELKRWALRIFDAQRIEDIFI